MACRLRLRSCPYSAYANEQYGAVFKTRISVTNVTGYSYTIRAGFSNAAGEVAVESFTMPPFATRTWDNVNNDGTFQLAVFN